MQAAGSFVSALCRIVRLRAEFFGVTSVFIGTDHRLTFKTGFVFSLEIDAGTNSGVFLQNHFHSMTI